MPIEKLWNLNALSNAYEKYQKRVRGIKLRTIQGYWLFIRLFLLRVFGQNPILRHTVASRMIRRGTSLKEVADFLGHRNLDTTAIYAKVDVPALRDVALPWPE